MNQKPVDGGYSRDGGATITVDPPADAQGREERWEIPDHRGPLVQDPNRLARLPGAEIHRKPLEVPEAFAHAIPSFVTLPAIPRVDEACEATKAMGEELEEFRSSLHKARRELVEGIKARIQTEPLGEPPQAGLRQRRELELIRSEMVFRDQFAEYLKRLIEERGSTNHATVALNEKRRLEREISQAIQGLGVPSKTFENVISLMAAASESFKKAVAKKDQGDANAAQWRSLMNEQHGPRLERRIQELTAELARMF